MHTYVYVYPIRKRKCIDILKLYSTCIAFEHSDWGCYIKLLNDITKVSDHTIFSSTLMEMKLNRNPPRYPESYDLQCCFASTLKDIFIDYMVEKYK
jgi:hypothetical protein